MNRIPSLDGFRAISIILILICHGRLSVGFPAGFVDLAQHGKVGVTVFFVISGFLITILLLKETVEKGKINVGEFYIRRAFRLLPVFLFYTAFILVTKNFQHITLSAANLIHVLTFTVNFDKETSWFLGHLWSLSVEEQFYLLWPLLLVFYSRHLQSILVIMILYGCIARIIDYKFREYSAYTLSPFFMYADAILIGALGATKFHHNPNFIKNKIFNNYALQVAALVIIILFIYLSGYGKMAIISLPFGNTVISACILYLLLNYITPSGNWVFRILNSKVMVHVGVLSYSIYIWQQFFFVGDEAKWYRVWPYNLLIICFVALASYYLLEKPFVDLRKRFKLGIG